MTSEKKLGHSLIAWLQQRLRKVSMSLRIINKAEGEGIEIDNFSMYAKIGSDRSSKSRTKLNKLLGQERMHGNLHLNFDHIFTSKLACPTCV